MLKPEIILQRVEFINNANVKTFTSFEQHKNLVLYKYDTPLHDVDFAIKHSRSFSLFELYTLSSLGIIFAYVVQTTDKLLNIKDKYITIKRPSVKNLDMFTGVELSYQSQFINIYISQDGAGLISANNLFHVIASSMVRKSAKDKLE